MKVTINIDCSPEEARTFLGLPDIKPMQDAMVAELEKRMRANLDAMDPETLFKTWFPAGIQGWEQMQKAFWGQMMRKTGEDDDS
ncbi:MAG: DUF6489 family protein [Rhodospirillaceae bacterium]